MKCKLVVGQKVVHVPKLGGKYNHREHFNDVTWPEPNGVYTISGLGPASNGEIGVTLAELGPQYTYKYQPRKGQKTGFQFDPAEFLPLSFLDIDLSVFDKALNSTFEENIKAGGGQLEDGGWYWPADEEDVGPYIPTDRVEVYKALRERWEKIMKDHHERHR